MTRTLTLLCCVLACVATWELSPVQRVTDLVTSGPSSSATTFIVRQSQQAADAFGKWAGRAQQRPIFAPDRRPAALTMVDKIGMARLTGIIAAPGHAMAIFQPTDDAKPMVVHEGEDVGLWRVVSVSQDAVILAQADHQIMLRPRFADDQAGEVVATVIKRQPLLREAAGSGLLRARWPSLSRFP